jgi:uncharacterized HAD superfamily protein
MKTIAIDIDDVLAEQAEAFIDYSNQTWGTTLSVSDYTEDWAKLWSVDLAEIEKRSLTYHASGTMGRFAHKSEAIPILAELRQSYRLIIITSRRSLVREETLQWINDYFSNTFEEIHFAGFFDKTGHGASLLTKADIARQVGADFLIDDQLKHCLAAATAGIDSIVFGDYHWNRTSSELPHGVTRCRTWHDVGDYFESRR